MIAPPESNKLTPDEYLQMEEKSPIKHGYIDGEIFAQAGATDTHVTIAGNIFALLRNHLRGSGCRVYISDMKVQVKKLNRFYYPDVMVTWDEKDRETPIYKSYPCLIIEVLSDSTEAFDRGDKFVDYQSKDSLQEYVLINTKHQRIECFRRNSEGLWVLQYYTPSESLFELKSINFQGKIEAVYEDVIYQQQIGQAKEEERRIIE